MASRRSEQGAPPGAESAFNDAETAGRENQAGGSDEGDDDPEGEAGIVLVERVTGRVTVRRVVVPDIANDR
jgi:hypothetical protein